MKKALIAGTSIATMALMAMPALAREYCCVKPVKKCCPETTVLSTNNTNVSTLNASISNSGLNQINQSGGVRPVKPCKYKKTSGSEAWIETGNTYAEAGVANDVGYNMTTVTAPVKGKVTVISTNNTNVRTANAAVSNSGVNQINQSGTGKAGITTGGAGSVSSVVNLGGTSITEVK